MYDQIFRPLAAPVISLAVLLSLVGNRAEKLLGHGS